MADESDVLLTEYEQVKKEQQGRIAHRDNLLYTTLAAMAAVGAAVISTHQIAVLLALPPVAVLLGWTYLSNDSKVTALGLYVRDQLAPRLAAVTSARGDLFGWEHANRAGRWRRYRKAMQLVVDLLVFSLAPIAALIVWWATTTTYTLGAVAVAEHILVAALTVFLAGPADLHTHHPAEGASA
jgi:hypothetical protein